MSNKLQTVTPQKTITAIPNSELQILYVFVPFTFKINNFTALLYRSEQRILVLREQKNYKYSEATHSEKGSVPEKRAVLDITQRNSFLGVQLLLYNNRVAYAKTGCTL
jgi:hypothetical protein